MATAPTETVSITIDEAPARITADLADPGKHPTWATEFFEGSARQDGEDWLVTVPRMGGEARMRIDADIACGRVDMFLAPIGAPYGAALPVRVVPNGDGCDVLFTLTRFPGIDDGEWQSGLASMRRELVQLRDSYAAH